MPRRRRFSTPKELLRAWAGANRSLAQIEKIRAETIAEKAAMLPDMAELLSHFPDGLVCDDVIYQDVGPILGGLDHIDIRETPAPADALDLDSWPDDGEADADGEARPLAALIGTLTDHAPIAADH